MKLEIKLTGLVILSLLLSSCASIIHGPTQLVGFTSNPSKARIVIDGKNIGQTPKKIELRRKGREKGDKSKKKEYAVEIALEGYHPYMFTISRKKDKWFFGNFLLCCGIGGIIIDASNGSMYHLSAEELAQADGLSKATFSLKKQQLYISVELGVDLNKEKIGQLIHR